MTATVRVQPLRATARARRAALITRAPGIGVYPASWSTSFTVVGHNLVGRLWSRRAAMCLSRAISALSAVSALASLAEAVSMTRSCLAVSVATAWAAAARSRSAWTAKPEWYALHMAMGDAQAATPTSPRTSMANVSRPATFDQAPRSPLFNEAPTPESLEASAFTPVTAAPTCPPMRPRLPASHPPRPYRQPAITRPSRSPRLRDLFTALGASFNAFSNNEVR